MSLRASEQARPKGLLTTSTTGTLYSDAIRLRKGVSISGTATPPIFIDAGRRSFQEPEVAVRRAPSPLVPDNVGLDISALVSEAQEGLRLRDGMETDASILEMMKAAKKKVKNLFKKKTKKKDDEEEEEPTEEEKRASARQQLIDAGMIPTEAEYALVEALVDAHEVVTQHALEVDGIDLATADADTRAMHAHVADAIAHLQIASDGAAWEEDADIGAQAWWDRHTGWAHEVDTGAPAWWERKKQQAKEAMGKAKGAMAKASEKAKQLSEKARSKSKAITNKASQYKEQAKKSSAGRLASRAKAATTKFANEKWARFTNEDRITKMERYDYGLYVSQNPLTDVLVNNVRVTLPAGGDPEAEFYDPHTHAVESSEPFYGLVATKQKDVLTNAQGDKAFNMAAKDTMKVLSVEKNRSLFASPIPDPAVDMLAQVDAMTLNMKDPGMLVKRALAQGEAQHHAVPDPNNTSSMIYPTKPNGAHPLCLGHAMMVPVAAVRVHKHLDHLGLVQAAVSDDWLKQVETDLVASPLREGFADMVSVEGADHKPFIIPMPSKFDEKSAAYSEAFGTSGGNPNESMRPVSALLVVPITSDLLEKEGAFKTTGTSVDFAYERLYPYQAAPERIDTRANYLDPAGDRRAELNAKLAEKGPFSSDNDLMEAATELGYDANKPTDPVTWTLSNGAFLQRYQVAVFALGISPVCDAIGEQAACEAKMDDAGTGKLLMISPHPLLMGERHDGTKFDGMEHPATVYTSLGSDKPLVNALSVALEGKHLDLRFLWAGMKIAQRCWEKATNSRVSKPSLSRFRYLVGQDRELWMNADKKFNLSGYQKSHSRFSKLQSGSFQRRSTGTVFDEARFGQALEELGLVRVTTGQQLKLDEMTPEEIDMALHLADIDLDSEEEE